MAMDESGLRSKLFAIAEECATPIESDARFVAGSPNRKFRVSAFVPTTNANEFEEKKRRFCEFTETGQSYRGFKPQRRTCSKTYSLLDNSFKHGCRQVYHQGGGIRVEVPMSLSFPAQLGITVSARYELDVVEIKNARTLTLDIDKAKYTIEDLSPHSNLSPYPKITHEVIFCEVTTPGGNTFYDIEAKVWGGKSRMLTAAEGIEGLHKFLALIGWQTAPYRLTVERAIEIDGVSVS
jgi:hypothetical protein